MTNLIHSVSAAHPAIHDAPVIVHAGGPDLTSGWNTLLSFAPSGLLTAMAAIGAAIVVWVLLRWWWKHRHGAAGGGLKSAPWLGILIGVILMAPSWIIPILLGMIGALISIFSNIFTGFAGILG